MPPSFWLEIVGCLNLEGVGLDAVEFVGQGATTRYTAHEVNGLLGSLAQTEVVT